MDERELKSALEAIIFASGEPVPAARISLVLGVYSAINQNTWKDNLAVLTSLIGLSMPQFWLGLLLVKVFAAAQQGIDSGKEHSQLEWFCHIIIAANIKPHNNIRFLIGSRQKHNRYFGGRPDFPAQVEAGTIRQCHIQNYQIIIPVFP